MEELTPFEKFRDFLNDQDNGIIIRISMVIIGIVLGGLLVLLSSIFEDKAVSITFLVFGCVIFGGFLIAPAAWWFDEHS